MKQTLDPQAIAKQPTQARAKARFERILEESEAILAESGLSGFSIPALATRLEYTRGSIYMYFPTPYAILNELLMRYLRDLEGEFRSREAELRKLPLRDVVSRVVDIAADFQDQRPAARLLMLGGAVTDDSYRAQELTWKSLGRLGRALFPGGGGAFPLQPDVATLSVDIATACFRRSFFEHGRITPAYRTAAKAAMLSFLESYARPTGRAHW